MADQRLLLTTAKGKDIVIAVRHGWTWRSAMEDRNDIGDFLNKLEEGDLISLSYETAPHDSPRDPTLIVGDSR